MSTQSNKLTAIADAIREKDGTTAPIEANDFPDRIRAIETGVDTSDATALADDVAEGKTAYAKGEKITGVVKTISDTISFPSDNISITQQVVGDVVISAPISESTLIKEGSTINLTAPVMDLGDAGEGSVLNNKTFSSALGIKLQGSMSQLDGNTWIPTTKDQQIAAGRYLKGHQIIKGDSNLVASNIKQGVTIFGITGTVSPGVDTSDATATAATIQSGYTAYVKGQKITGQVPTKSGSTITPGTVAKLAVSSGTITTGTIYVAGDANLKAENIKSGVSIFGVAGTASSYYYSGLINNTYLVTNSTSKSIYIISFDNTGQYIRKSIPSGATISTTAAAMPFLALLSQNGTISGITVSSGPNIQTLLSGTSYRIIYPMSEGNCTFSVY